MIPTYRSHDYQYSAVPATNIPQSRGDAIELGVDPLGVDPLGDAISWKRRRPDAYRALVLWAKDVADGVRPSMDACGRLREPGIPFATHETRVDSWTEAP
jgi:hypothetical protein